MCQQKNYTICNFLRFHFKLTNTLKNKETNEASNKLNKNLTKSTLTKPKKIIINLI